MENGYLGTRFFLSGLAVQIVGANLFAIGLGSLDLHRG